VAEEEAAAPGDLSVGYAFLCRGAITATALVAAALGDAAEARAAEGNRAAVHLPQSLWLPA
jgi:hypothetical protein